MSEAAGAWEIVTQMMSVIPRVLIIALIMVFVITPVSCYVNRKHDLENLENLEKFTAINTVKYCIREHGFSEARLKDCFKQENYGLKITKGKEEIVLSEDIYKKQYYTSRFVRGYEKIKINGEEIIIDLVFMPNE